MAQTTSKNARVRGSMSSELPVADRALRAIRRIVWRTSEHSRQLASAGGLSVPQALCLKALAMSTRSEPLTVAELAAAVQLSNATASRILDRLELAELIVRQRSAVDRRKVYLWLTARGRKRAKQLPALIHAQFVSRLLRLPKSEQRALLAALEKVAEMMGSSDWTEGTAPPLNTYINSPSHRPRSSGRGSDLQRRRAKGPVA